MNVFIIIMLFLGYGVFAYFFLKKKSNDSKDSNTIKIKCTKGTTVEIKSKDYLFKKSLELLLKEKNHISIASSIVLFSKEERELIKQVFLLKDPKLYLKVEAYIKKKGDELEKQRAIKEHKEIVVAIEEPEQNYQEPIGIPMNNFLAMIENDGNFDAWDNMSEEEQQKIIYFSKKVQDKVISLNVEDKKDITNNSIAIVIDDEKNAVKNPPENVNDDELATMNNVADSENSKEENKIIENIDVENVNIDSSEEEPKGEENNNEKEPSDFDAKNIENNDSPQEDATDTSVASSSEEIIFKDAEVKKKPIKRKPKSLSIKQLEKIAEARKDATKFEEKPKKKRMVKTTKSAKTLDEFLEKTTEQTCNKETDLFMDKVKDFEENFVKTK